MQGACSDIPTLRNGIADVGHGFSVSTAMAVLIQRSCSSKQPLSGGSLLSSQFHDDPLAAARPEPSTA
jgi:hypothetical protein